MLMVYLMALDGLGEKARFLWIYTHLRHRMYRAALVLLRDEDRAQEAVQESFKKIISRFSKIYALSAEETAPYVVTIVENTAKDMLRARRPTQALEAVVWEPPAAEDAESASGYRGIVALIRAMPDQYREVLLLKFVEEETDAAIARRLGLSLSQVSNRVSRGRALLIQRLKEEGYEP